MEIIFIVTVFSISLISAYTPAFMAKSMPTPSASFILYLTNTVTEAYGWLKYNSCPAAKTDTRSKDFQVRDAD